MRTRKSERDLTPQQRRREIIDILAIGAARTTTTVANSTREKLSANSKTLETRLDVSATMPLSVSTTASGSRDR